MPDANAGAAGARSVALGILLLFVRKKRHFVIIAFSFCRSYGKLSAIEGHNRMEFFKIVYNYTFVIQLLSLDLSLVIAFYPLEKTVKSYLFALLHLAGLFAFSTLLNWGLFELTMVMDGFSGINFLLAWLIIIALYTALNRKNLVGCAIMGATLYVIVIAIGDFGRDFTRARGITLRPRSGRASWGRAGATSPSARAARCSSLPRRIAKTR